MDRRLEVASAWEGRHEANIEDLGGLESLASGLGVTASSNLQDIRSVAPGSDVEVVAWAARVALHLESTVWLSPGVNDFILTSGDPGTTFSLVLQASLDSWSASETPKEGSQTRWNP